MNALPLSKVRQNIAKVADAALSGKPSLIIRKSKLLILQAYTPPDPIPLRPPGYFRDCHTAEEIAEVNYLASQSSIAVKP